ncbi:hypothetical protein GCM10011415_39500 [Salipiger pallidus]|uniref:Uncharacterized protein n=1 Tax=Salipiger pallidus TaxID=1775170 RepID=A0A8J2ZNN3_9RHOB|nr:hypothetical protein [Salipiger pallidus]GGG85360.1 hypothetical protein GCM10011415_39500 [Salipiger pallidus]
MRSNDLTDREDNGIAIYAHPPKQDRSWRDGEVHNGAEPLDVDEIMGSPDLPLPVRTGAPQATSRSGIPTRDGRCSCPAGAATTTLRSASR